MQKKAQYKVSGGKLIRITSEVEDNTLKDIQITGDFFLHPEETIEGIEAALRGTPLEKEALTKKIEEAATGAKMVGVSAADFADAILQAS